MCIKVDFPLPDGPIDVGTPEIALGCLVLRLRKTGT